MLKPTNASRGRKKAPPLQTDNPVDDFTCNFCKKTYVTERAYLTHLCSLKQRYLDRDLQHVKMAYAIYQHWWTVSYGAKRGMKRTYDDFMRSRQYMDFVRFGRYLREIDAINPMAFVDYLIRGGAKISDWQKPSVYEVYLRDLTRRETPTAAIERNILLMEQWATRSGEQWTDFFRKIAPALAVTWIRSGRISPWVLYTAPSADALFSRLSDEQIALIESYIDPVFWRKKLDEHKEDKNHIEEILADAGC